MHMDQYFLVRFDHSFRFQSSLIFHEQYCLLFLIPLILLLILFLGFNSYKSKINTCNNCGAISLGLSDTCMNCGENLNDSNKESKYDNNPGERTIEVKAEEVK